MTAPVSTCWTMIREAADGDAAARERFAAVYAPAVRAYLAARWRDGALRQAVDDAAQDVFVELFREGGALEGLRPDGGGGFRGFLYGVVRNVARRHEQRRRRTRTTRPATAVLADLADDEPRLSRIFDLAWAKSLLREAQRLQQRRARASGAAAVRRHDLLRLRFGEGLPIRDIAERWREPAERLHREYGKARREFLAALLEVMRFHHPQESEARLLAEARDLIGLLSAAS